MAKTTEKQRPATPVQAGSSPDIKKWLIRGAIAVGVVLIAAFFAGTEGGDNDTKPTGVTEFDPALIGREHVEGVVTYDQIPPPGGDHNPVWLNCGTYSTPIPTENAVHSLEHGSVWIAYDPTIPQDQIDTLAGLGSGSVIVSPIADLEAPIVAVAWAARQTFTDAGDANIRQFVRYYQSGVFAPEPGAACVGGIGTPG